MKVYRAPKGSVQAKENKEKRKARLTGAHTTKPIIETSMVRTWLQIAKEHDAHRTHGGPEWYLLLVIGFNTGLRISDIVKLRVKDVRGRENLTVIEKKTGKERMVPIRWNVRKVLDELLKDRQPEEFILPSRKRSLADGTEKGISRQRAYTIIKIIAKRAGYTEHVGCHTMRKTYAWSLFDASGNNLALVQKILNHSSQEMTMHYIGIDQQDIVDAVGKMRNMV